MPAWDEGKNCGHGDEWSRDARYGTSIGGITSACKDRKHIGTKRNVKLEQDHVSSSAIFLSFSAEVISFEGRGHSHQKVGE